MVNQRKEALANTRMIQNHYTAPRGNNQHTVKTRVCRKVTLFAKCCVFLLLNWNICFYNLLIDLHGEILKNPLVICFLKRNMDEQDEP